MTLHRLLLPSRHHRSSELHVNAATQSSWTSLVRHVRKNGRQGSLGNGASRPNSTKMPYMCSKQAVEELTVPRRLLARNPQIDRIGSYLHDLKVPMTPLD